ncbi:serine acetyltransferase [bacterium D16-51]|nr:serine acetyltransferase [bacterium D16-59]RKI55832.1 serine acetyltransferase [bacterium D16-51]
MDNLIEKEMGGIVDAILGDYGQMRAIDKMDLFNQPDKESIIDMVKKLFCIVFPGYFRDKSFKIYNVNNNLSVLIEDIMYHLNKQVEIVLKYDAQYEGIGEEALRETAQRKSISFLKKIPKVREYLDTDLQAAFDGDPAAYYKDDIVYSYPGLYAITVNRLAHELYLLEVPMIPRIMTEYAHNVTGIDIHPGAVIGKYFFIDHGTGVVIGETTVIGENVKIYQGVTLGALSTRGGQKLRGAKRHPTIEDNVVIYSGASVLGGETVIGENAIIGSNAFVTKSIGKNSRVSIKNQELSIREHGIETVKEKELGQDETWCYVI